MGAVRGELAVVFMPLIAPEQITSHCETGSWRRLEQVALALVRDASERAGPPLRPLLGGGTRLMLALQHRISHDIDLFIRDPHWLGYLSPRLNDRFENQSVPTTRPPSA